MRKLIFFLFCILLYLKGFSTSYYFSAGGNDSRSPTQAQSVATPWLSINRLNTFFAGTIPTFPGVKPVAGDSILFRRGDVFPAASAIIIGVSGVIIGSYSTSGNTAKPIIDGYIDLTFTSHVGSIWTSVESINVDPLNLVTLNGNVIGIGRRPQTGWYNIDSHTTSTITSTGLAGQPTWNTSTAVALIRLAMWVNGKYALTGQASNQISFTNTHESVDGLQNGWGFFIQDDAATLTYLSAWYLNRSTNKLQYVHNSSTVAPTGIRASNVSDLVTCNGFSNISIVNLSFRGANDTCINIIGGSRVNVQNCVLNGQELGIRTTATNSTYSNDSILNSMNNGIWIKPNATTDTTNNNFIYNTSVIVGAGGYINNVRDDDGCGINTREDGTIINNNVIKNTGVCGIWVYRVDNISVRNNVVDSFDVNRSDLGGIYFVSNSATITNTNRKVIHNIVSHGIGPRAGTTKTKGNDVGIYMDNGAYGVTIDSNSVSYSTVGIFVHSSSNINIRNNSVFNVDTAIQINHESSSNKIPQNCIITKNILFLNASESNQRTLMVSDYAIQSQINLIGIIDSNYYLRPIGATNDAIYDYNTGPGTGTKRTLGSWQTAHNSVPYDVHSSIGTYTYNNTTGQSDSTLFYSNPTSTPLPQSLPGTYKDIYGTTYAGSVTIQPFASVLLFLITSGVLPPSNSNFKIRGYRIIVR